MAKDSFQEQYPEYHLIPDRRPAVIRFLSKYGYYILGPIAVALAIGLPWALLHSLGQLEMPVANMAGISEMAVEQARSMAVEQLSKGQYQASVLNFRNYFAWGGKDPEAMKYYGLALEAIGMQDESKSWIERSRVKALEDAREETK